MVTTSTPTGSKEASFCSEFGLFLTGNSSDFLSQH